MAIDTRALRRTLVLAVLAGLLVSATGCGYLKNVRDDLLDCGSMAVGIVPPVVPSSDGAEAVGFLPPAIGAYVEFTQFCHLGALYKATGDLEWDRRGYGTTIDTRRKIGVGLLHDVYVEQQPVCVNAYKVAGNRMDGWRNHMEDLSDPVFGSPAKIMIFEAESPYVTGEDSWKSLPWLSRGWQDWEFISAEVAIPEPFILHSGFYMRVGADPSQVVDLLLSIFCIDMHSDAAYKFWGDLKY